MSDGLLSIYGVSLWLTSLISMVALIFIWGSLRTIERYTKEIFTEFRFFNRRFFKPVNVDEIPDCEEGLMNIEDKGVIK